MPRPLSRASLVAGELLLLLSIRFAGRWFRFSTRPVDVSSSSPTGTDLLRFDGGLEGLDPEQVLALLADAPEQLSVSVELLFPDDVAELIEEGHDLAAATGELVALVEGDLYEDGYRLVAGRVSQPEYGAAGEPVALSLVQDLGDDVALLPPSSCEVNLTTWSSAPDDSIGKCYPVPFGRPGVYVDADGTASTCPGSPAIPVVWDGGLLRYDKLLIAWGRVAASSVDLWYKTPGGTVGTVTVAVTHELDGLSQECATLALGGIPASARVEGTKYGIIWNHATGGALVNPHTGSTLELAGDVLRWFAEQSSIPFDLGRVIAAASQLEVKVAGYLDEHCRPLSWLQDNLLPILPISITSGPGGLFPVVWRYAAGPLDAVDYLEAGAGVTRQGRIAYERRPRELVASVRIAYALDFQERTRRRSYTLAPALVAGDSTTSTSTYTIAAATRYTEGDLDAGAALRVLELDYDVVYSDATAAWIAAWKIRAFGLAHRVGTYLVDEDRAWLSLGDPVLLTDAELHLDELLALVVGYRLAMTGAIELRLQLLATLATGGITTGPDPQDPPPWEGGT